MASTGIFLSQQDVSTLSPQTREELERFIFGHLSPSTASPEEDAAEGPATAREADEEGPADFSVAQANRLLNGCSERPKKALRFIASQPANGFSYKDLVKELGEDSTGTIRGVLSAITRRTRTVLGDSKADIIWWNQDKAEAWTGSVSPMTHSSLRKALGLS